MATRKIAGITIKIGGDTTELQKSLGKVDKQLSSTQNTLKDINKLLKLNPGNVELLTQKQKNLQSAISTTKERLDTLKKAQTDALSPKDYDALQREIIETEGNLKSLEAEYKSFGSVGAQQIQNVGNKVSDVGKKMTKFGTNMTKYVTAPIIAVGVAANAAFNEVDEGIDTIIQTTGASGDDLESMKTIMEEIATEIPTDFATAGEAVGAVNTRFHATGEQLKTLSTQYIKFAKLNNTDVTSAVNSTEKALAAYGLTADDAGDYLDRLTKVSQQTGIDVGTLSDGIVRNSATFKELGFSIDDATVFMGQLEVSGADANVVLAGMRKALKNAAAEGKPLDAALAELQTTIDKGKGSTDGLTAAYELFGTAGAQVYEAVKNGTLDFNNLATAADDAAGTVSTTFDATLDPADQFQTALNAVKLTAADIAETVMPAVSRVLSKVRDIVLTLKERWDGLDASTQDNIIKFTALVAAAGPVVTVLGKIVGGGGTVISAFGKIVGAISAAGGLIPAIGGLVTAAGPILAGGAVVAGVIAAVVLIVKNWDKIKKFAGELKDKVVKAWNDMKTKVSDAAKKVGDFVVKTWDNIKSKVSKTASDIKTGVINAWNGIKTGLSNVMSNIKDGAIKAWTDLKNGIIKILNAIKTAIINAWNAIKTTVASIGTGIKDGVIKAWDGIKTGVGKAVDGIKTGVINGWNNIKTGVGNAVESIKTTVSTKWEGLKTTITQKTESIRTTVANKWENLKSAISTKVSNIGTSISTTWTNIKSNVLTLTEGITSGIKSKWDGLKSTLSNTASNIKSSVSNAFSGLKNNISTTWSNIKTAMTNPIQNAKTAISTALSNISGLFSRQKWSLPSLKMPHFSWEWQKVGNLISLPKISVKWYRKAYDSAMMFNSPTVLPTARGLKGFGDGPGGEVVLSARKLRDIAGAGGDTNVNITINTQPGQSAEQIAAEVERVFVRAQRQREAAYA